MTSRILRLTRPGAAVKLRRVTERLHRDDPYLLEFDAVVRERREHQGRPAVVLDRTAFYAESGGQPWDLGLLEDARVVAVIEDGGGVVHVLDRPIAADRVHGRVDAARRRDHMQQHHGQHLLSKAFVELAQAATVAFHLGGEDTTVDLDRFVGQEQARAAETRVNDVVWQARPVRVASLTAKDHRTRDPRFQPPQLEINLAFVDSLQQIAASLGWSVAELAIAWTLSRPEVTAAIVGARSPEQIEKTVSAGDKTLDSKSLKKIAAVLQIREQHMDEVEAIS
jgi:alanyl-tRNA synthetase